MRIHIERDILMGNVKVYIMEESPSGRAFLWPVEYEEFGWSWFRYQEGGENIGQPVMAIRPALEMSLPMWEAFTKSLMESEHIRVDALDLIAATLKREQDRVDKLIDYAISPPQEVITHAALPH